MIPSTWKRYQLSQLVNKTLSLTRVVPFDFLIHGEILKGSLGEWCAEKGLGVEQTLEIEYIESIMPPQQMSSIPHEDWVSSISCQLPGHFLTASYDGNLRVFDYSQKLLHSAAIHAAPITSFCLIPSASQSSSERLLATASHDLTATLTRLTAPEASNPSTQALATLHLHTAPLTSISSHHAGTQLLTASQDGLIGLWDTIVPENDEVPLAQVESAERKKRRRVDDAQKPKRKAPQAVLKSHTARVSKALFAHEEGKAVSSGWDSTIKEWDLELGICIHTITASEKPFTSLALPAPQSHPKTAIASSTDRTTTLFDLRSTASTSSSLSFMHPSTPSCLAFAPSAGAQQFVSGAYDGVVRLWDLRSAGREMASFKVWGGTKKVLDVDWVEDVIGIAGEGGVEVWRVSEDGSAAQ